MSDSTSSAPVTGTELIESDIEEYLRQHQDKELLRFVFCGSVDDGKSTLIGRLLHDTKGIYEDQLNAVKRASKTDDSEIDFSLFTDGLKAEREQGITIDVAYRYFSTAKRKFIVADTPGHVQYTRNMATGASTANVAVILIDARLGVLQQSRRHAYIASLLGIPHIAVAVNKMDLVDFAQERFEEIKEDFSAVASKLDLPDVTYLPISAKQGDNVVSASSKLSWFDGPTMLDYLEAVPVAHDRNLDDFRFPVQLAIRPDLNYRGFAGQIASGRVSPGDEVMVLPSRKRSRVRSVDTFEGELDRAEAPLGVTLRLEDEIDISRGDMIVHPDNLPHVGRRFDAMLVWMSERPLDAKRSYLVKHTTQYVRANVDDVAWQLDLETLERVEGKTLSLNDIGRVRVHTHRPLFFDGYEGNHGTGAFIVIDSVTNDTVAAGMIVEPSADAGTLVDSDQSSHVSRAERVERCGCRGGTVWLTGPAASGKTAVAYALERMLFDAGATATVVDANDGVSADLGRAGTEMPAEAAELARRLADCGVIAIFAFQSPGAKDRARVRDLAVATDAFIEVSIGADAANATAPAGGSGKPSETGGEGEAPGEPATELSLDGKDPESAAASVLTELRARKWLPR